VLEPGRHVDFINTVQSPDGKMVYHVLELASIGEAAGAAQ